MLKKDTSEVPAGSQEKKEGFLHITPGGRVFDYESAKAAYLEDPTFHGIVDLFVHIIETSNYSNQGLRNAVILARAIILERKSC